MHYCKECGSRIVEYKKGRPKMYQIIDVVLEYFKVNIAYVRLKNRAEHRVYVKQVLMYFLKEKINMSLKGIGKIYPCHHTTVMKGILSIKNRMDTDQDVKRDIDTIESILRTLVVSYAHSTKEHPLNSD